MKELQISSKDILKHQILSIYKQNDCDFLNFKNLVKALKLKIDNLKPHLAISKNDEIRVFQDYGYTFVFENAHISFSHFNDYIIVQLSAWDGKKFHQFNYLFDHINKQFYICGLIDKLIFKNWWRNKNIFENLAKKVISKDDILFSFSNFKLEVIEKANKNNLCLSFQFFNESLFSEETLFSFIEHCKPNMFIYYLDESFAVEEYENIYFNNQHAFIDYESTLYYTKILASLDRDQALQSYIDFLKSNDFSALNVHKLIDSLKDQLNETI